MRRHSSVPLCMILLAGAGCDQGPNGQLNDAANYVRPVSNKDKVAKTEGVLVLDPTPFAPGTAVTPKAQFNQPNYVAGNHMCGNQDAREYRLKFIPLNEAGAPVPMFGIPTTAPYANAANGARVALSFDPAIIPAPASPGLRAVVSFYQRYCAQSTSNSGSVNTVQWTDIPVAQAEYRYDCGGDLADRCRYVAIPKP